MASGAVPHGAGKKPRLRRVTSGVPPQLPPPKTFRERLGALRNLPPFLKLVWQTSPGITVAQVVLRLVRALLPVATLYVGALIIDEVVRLTHAPSPGTSFAEWFASGALGHIALLLVLEFALGVALGPARSRRLAPGFAPLGKVQHRDQRSPDAARGHARPGGLRG